MKTYLVTGGAGFIGSNFIIYMLNKYQNINIINLDKLTYAGNLENLSGVQSNPGYTFLQGDICSREMITTIFDNWDIDYVVNFAAESHVDRSIMEPGLFTTTNTLGAVNLLEGAKSAWESHNGFPTGKRFIQISTDEVYGSLGATGLFTESTPLNPHSPYSASKAGGDLMVKAYFDTYKMPVNITRCSNNYGPRQLHEKLIPLLISNCLNHRKLPIYGDGLNVRDWLYVEDHCIAIDMILDKGKPGEIYNIGGNNERTNLQIVDTIIKYLSFTDKDINDKLITFIEDRKGHDRRYGIDSAKIKRQLGWCPRTSFEAGMEKTITWYLDHKHIIKNELR